MFGTDRSTHSSPDKARSLRGIRILGDLEPKELALLAAECDWRSYARNDVVFSAGQGGTLGEVVFVVSGAIRLARPTGPNGRISYVDIQAGGQFGETGILGLDDDDLTAIARDDTLLALLPEARFSELLGRQESVSRALLCQYAKLLRAREAAAGTAEDTRPGSTGAQRVYAELLALAEPRGPAQGATGEAQGGLFVPRLPRHRELADRLSTTEEVVAAAIAELVRLDIAERDYPGLRIKNEASLRGLCGTR
ncbi:cyclic nucleotide-binding domain-containing protein [Parvibaculum sp.]|uniref:Crp/Fnr family transcriptional regulator n=1 Tax=Parvibaculum sp. TaxID=2024848 RepID=UPI002CF09530|nr:cyclic nucleotide-binding domain-containing protein [Parvibaculum sp.]HUD52977.1 cyclic nucleotide-binding domain-containing protein [Parvibaculum sp.]